MKNRFKKSLSLMVVSCVCIGLFGICSGTLPKLFVSATGSNLVVNGGAEDGTNNWIGMDDWTFILSYSPVAEGYESDHSFKVKTAYNYMYQAVTLEKDVTYTLSFYSKGTATQLSEVSLLTGNDGKGSTLTGIWPKTDDTDWTYYSIQYTSPSTQTACVRVKNIIAVTDWEHTELAYNDRLFDNISLIKEVEPEITYASAPTVYVGGDIDLAVYGDGTRNWQGIPSISMDKQSGRLWSVWYSGGEGEEIGNYLIAYTSTDGGESWGEPNMVVAPPENSRCFDPNFWVDPDGNMWLFWTESNGGWFDGYGGVWAMKTENPEAEFPTWTEPKRIANGIAMNDPVVLSNGNWMLPTNVLNTITVSGITDERNCNAYISTDKGANWYYQGSVKEYTAKQTGAMNDHLENMIVEANDKLYMYVRTHDGIEVGTSTDNGVTWSKSIFAGITKTSSRFYIGALGDKMLMVYNDPPEGNGRSHMTAAFVTIADDGTLTATNKVVIDERNNTSYPDVAVAEDGTINIIYDRIRFQGHGEVLMARITAEDIINGSVSATSKVKMLINDNRYTNTDGAILDNGSFENGERSWNYNGGNNFIEITEGDGWTGISTTVAHSGTKSLQVRDTKYAHFSQHFSVEKNTDYVLSFWVKGAAASSCNLNFRLGDLGTESGSIITNSPITYNWTDAWQQVVYRFNSGENLDLSFTIQNTADAGSAVRYLDDFIILKASKIEEGLLSDSSFEKGFDGWDASDDQIFLFGIDTEAHSGNYSLSIGNNWCFVNQKVAVKKNTDYILSYWIKGGKHGLGVYVGKTDASDWANDYIAQYWPGVADDWTRYSGRINSGENESLKVVFRATKNDNNSGYAIRKIDDVVLREVGDVNADETVDIRDLVRQKKYNDNVQGVTVDHDVTGDSITDSADLNKIKAKLLGLN